MSNEILTTVTHYILGLLHLRQIIAIVVMRITIDIQPDTTLNELKHAFAQHFPYLKWEFFRHSHQHHEGSHKKDMILDNPTLQKITHQIQQHHIEFHDTNSVQDIEQLIWDAFGLSVQVFRKSGNLWLETTITDQWSLAYQNEQGRELSAQFDRKK